MISAVMPGIVATPVRLLAAKSPMSNGRDVSGSPRGRTAAAILGPRLAENLAVKIALSIYHDR
jgi:hypothetical protein